MQNVLISINAVYNFDPTIFDGLKLPAISDLPNDPDLYISDPEPLDKNILIGNILMELGEMSLVYSDPGTIKTMISIWSSLSKRVWLDLWKTLLYKYNPIWNKDGTYTEIRELAGTKKDMGTGSVGTDTNTGSNKSAEVLDDVTGYDCNTYSPNTRTSTSDDTSVNAVSSTSSSFNNNTQTGEKETLTRLEHGNIGVTTTQAMIREQREIVEFNMYQYITESFKERFCIMTY